MDVISRIARTHDRSNSSMMPCVIYVNCMLSCTMPRQVMARRTDMTWQEVEEYLDDGLGNLRVSRALSWCCFGAWGRPNGQCPIDGKAMRDPVNSWNL